jgi:hypothetical protein
MATIRHFRQGFSSENWEEALAFQIGKIMRDNCLFWENKIHGKMGTCL